MAASICHFVTAATKFSCCSSNKKLSPLFLSLALNPCRPFSRWASLACCPLSLFLCLSLALYFKFVDMTIYLSLILIRQHGYRNNFRLPFSSLLTLLLSLLYKTLVAMRFPAKITTSCIWVAMLVDWVILHCYACGADGRSLGRVVGVRSRDYQIFSDGLITSFSNPWCSAGALCARELRYEWTMHSIENWQLAINS